VIRQTAIYVGTAGAATAILYLHTNSLNCPLIALPAAVYLTTTAVTVICSRISSTQQPVDFLLALQPACSSSEHIQLCIYKSESISPTARAENPTSQFYMSLVRDRTSRAIPFENTVSDSGFVAIACYSICNIPYTSHYISNKN
jgi:hypothetical protein